MVRRNLSLTPSRISESSECSTEPTRSIVCVESPMSDGSSLPSPFGQSGHIRSRTSTASILLRKWQDSFWVHVLPATLMIFRSEQDFQKWAERDHSPRKNRKVLLHVDFDTLGVLAGRNNMERGLNSNSLLSNSKGSSAKLVSKLQKYSLGDVTTALYGSEALFVFKLERFSDVGVDAVASFASADQSQLRAFRRVIHDCIQITSRSKRRGPERSKAKSLYLVNTREEEDTHVASTVAESEMTGLSRPHVARSGGSISLSLRLPVVRRASSHLSSVSALEYP